MIHQFAVHNNSIPAALITFHCCIKKHSVKFRLILLSIKQVYDDISITQLCLQQSKLFLHEIHHIFDV